MTRERAKRATDIVRTALEHDPHVRSAYLEEACAGDAPLRKEVESLLDAHKEEQSEQPTIAHPLWPAGSEENDQDPTDDRWETGTKVSHYRVLKKIGEGGMGEVYLAEDMHLRRSVALKVIAEQLTRNEGRKQRFVQEALAAAAIEHPHIAAVHDIDHSGDRTFIVMEYVRGETLRPLIRDKKLDVPRVLELARQIADALSKVHEHGIVHRDLKPENILVSQDGYVKIIDFGLAKLFEPLSLSADVRSSDFEAETQMKTREGATVGTMAYMSPEQAKGEPVNSRSDIFTFGVLLYEMLSGKRPFQRPTTVESLSALLRDKPLPLELPTELAKGSTELKRILDKALAKEPAKRYQDIKSLAVDLQQLREDMTQTRIKPSRTLVAAAVALVGFLLFGTWWLAQRGSPQEPAAVPDPVSVLIADFQNRTDDPVFDGALEQAAAIGLEGAPFINSYRRGRARAEAQEIRPDATSLDEEMAMLVAQREGINVIISGAIEGMDRGYKISVNAIDALTGDSLAADDAEVEVKDEVLSALGELIVQTRIALGDATPESVQSATSETFTAGSLEAARVYAQAQEFMVVGEWQEAITEYQRAVELDPDFGRAYAGLAACCYNLGQFGEAREYYEMAMARIDRMTDRERYRTRGGYYLMVRNYEKAAEEYQTLIDEYPYEPAGLANLPMAYFYSRDMERTLEAARRVTELYPENILSRGNLALFAMYAGDFTTALEQAEIVLETNPSYETAYVAAAITRLDAGELEQAAETYLRLAGISPRGACLANTGLADLALYTGQLSEARELLAQGIVESEAAGYNAECARKRLLLAQLYLTSGDSGKAIAEAEQALATSQSEHVLYLSAAVFMEAGREARALEIAAELGSRLEPEPQTFAKQIEGQIHLKRGEVQQSTAVLWEAQSRLDTWLGRFHLGRAYIEAGAFTEAHSELETCLKRRGEATSVFFDDVPSYHFLPPVYYYFGRAQEGLGSPGAAGSYETFLSIKQRGENQDPLVADAQRRLASLR